MLDACVALALLSVYLSCLLPGVQTKIANLAIMPPGAAEDGRATANEIPPRVESAKPVAREAKLLYRC